MARLKLDGVIEAVRYNPAGKIEVARVYERHGLVWSDHILLNRQDLVEWLKQGKKIATGVRKSYLGSVFETGPVVHYKDDQILTAGQVSSTEKLPGVSEF
jgi:hypothetical protein